MKKTKTTIKIIDDSDDDEEEEEEEETIPEVKQAAKRRKKEGELDRPIRDILGTEEMKKGIRVKHAKHGAGTFIEQRIGWITCEFRGGNIKSVR